MENPIKIDDGTPIFGNTHISASKFVSAVTRIWYVFYGISRST